MMEHFRVIAIGASAGGVGALKSLVRQLPQDFPGAVFVVQHVSPESPDLLASILNENSALPVESAVDGRSVRSGTIVIAPPDRHLLVYQDQVRLSKGPKENSSRPSIDVLFRSVATSFTTRAIGVVMTGFLYDGSHGCHIIKRCGGTSVVQDPAGASYPDLPRNTIDLCNPDYIVGLNEMGELLIRLVQEPVGPPIDVPQDIMLENKIAEESMRVKDLVEQWGTPVPMVCPECGGPIFKNEDKASGSTYFRCYVGHAYTTESLAAEHVKSLEYKLWSVVRSFEQHADICDIRAREEQAHDRLNLAARYEEWATRSRETAEKLRAIVETALKSPDPNGTSAYDSLA